MKKILLIDDDRDVLLINKKFLESQGFQVHCCSNPKDGIRLARKLSPDCILLDVMMPDMDGYQVCQSIRIFSDSPIIFLTGKTTEDDKVRGLTCGADDFIVKPYSLKELKARIDAVLRRMNRSAPAADSNILIFGDLSIDRITHKAAFCGEDLALTQREYDVLLYMALHPNTDISFQELGIALFNSYTENDRRLVMVNVSRLRKKLSVSPRLENMIETVWSKGYRFNGK